MRSRLLGLVVPLVFAAPAPAQIVFYDFVGGSGSQVGGPTAAPTISDNAAGRVTASNVTRGSGITPFASNPTTNDSIAATGFGSTFDSNDFFTFSVAATSGFALELQSLVLRLERSTDGPNSVAVRSSADGFAANIGDVLPVSTASSPTGPSTAVVNLRSALPGLLTNVEFRVFGFGATSPNGFLGLTDIFDTDINGNDRTLPGVELFGTVVTAPVPEPSTYALIGLTLVVGGIAYRRRQTPAIEPGTV